MSGFPLLNNRRFGETLKALEFTAFSLSSLRILRDSRVCTRRGGNYKRRQKKLKTTFSLMYDATVPIIPTVAKNSNKEWDDACIHWHVRHQRPLLATYATLRFWPNSTFPRGNRSLEEIRIRSRSQTDATARRTLHLNYMKIEWIS